MRVRNEARVGRREHPVGVRTNRRGKPLKIVFESITQEKKRFRTVASYNLDPPAGYLFVPVGYPDLTELCKKQCQDQNLQFQTVNAKPKNKANLDPGKVSHHIHRVGNHFPSDVVHSCCRRLGYWNAGPGSYKKYDVRLEERLSKHKDKDDKEQTRSAIQELFPKLPAKDLKDILHHAFKKGSMRVGEAREMPLIRRVQLAVSAHARHNYTNYDKLLKQVTWEEARAMAEQPTLRQLKAWRGEDADEHGTEEVFREFIIIDSDSDEDHDDDSDDSLSTGDDREASIEIISHTTFGDSRATGTTMTARNGFVDPYTGILVQPGLVQDSPYRSHHAPSSSRQHPPQYRYEPVASVDERHGAMATSSGHSPLYRPREVMHQVPAATRGPYYELVPRRPVSADRLPAQDLEHMDRFNERPIQRDAPPARSTHLPYASAIDGGRYDPHQPYHLYERDRGPVASSHVPYLENRQFAYPDMPRSAADVPIRSVEVDMVGQQPYGEAQSPRPQMRLQTDRTGQTVIVRVPEQDPYASDLRPTHPIANHAGGHEKLPEYRNIEYTGRTYALPRARSNERYSPTYALPDSRPREFYQDYPSLPTNPPDQRDAAYSQRPQDYVLHYTDRLPQSGPDWIAAPRLVPIQAGDYQPSLLPQTQTREDRSHRRAASQGHALPASPRKPYSKRHQPGRPRYHDHDSSAGQQERPLDY